MRSLVQIQPPQPFELVSRRETSGNPGPKGRGFPFLDPRHTFAALFIRNGGDSLSLQEMTKRYVHLASRDVAEQHKKFSPMTALLGQGPDTISGRAPLTIMR